MRLYLDSSALMKCYLPEPGCDRVLALFAEATEVILSVLVVPEGVSVLNRCRREGRISAAQYGDLKKMLMADVAHATVIELGPAVIARAVQCLEAAPLRASDSVHVASALECHPDRFLTGDERQHEAAQAVGLNSELVG
ncbi:MAG: type II toxin-antitoxin system VapC family toxin [Planctomycetes bacterium]|nr:type II toxin-antitoxin system VapC family toxin [Planctomycetota bacterium]